MKVDGAASGPVVLDTAGLAAAVETLIGDGWSVIAPTVRDGAMVHDVIESVADLPTGWGDKQEPGRYRLRRRDDSARFGYAAPAQSWKRLLFPPRTTLWRAHRPPPGSADRDAGDFVVQVATATPRYAFLGARACEVRAIEIQDRVFLGGAHTDPGYRAARESALVIAVNCSSPADTCFCSSMDAGPRVASGADVVLTEVAEPQHREPWYLAEAFSDRGAALLRRVPSAAATPEAIDAADAVVANAAAHMGREMPDVDLHELLSESLEHPRWDDVAERCLACTSCTLVCPTCFCSSVEDVTDLTGTEARRDRRWASCFELDHSYLHGGSIRSGIRSMYRQWLTHKLGTWFDQFGTSGCVGCGRCVTWCPAGIDITEEIRAIAGPHLQEVTP
ncbi:MAG: 4Fe-4S dicluster domain-containing protein [Acidimicrobiia bacterium]|nr:4Fe-4S dicluster domain-containing protein [Acidimicrobiia bacterium]